MTLAKVLLQCPSRRRFLMSKVPLYSPTRTPDPAATSSDPSRFKEHCPHGGVSASPKPPKARVYFALLAKRVPHLQENAPPYDPTLDLYLGSLRGPREVGIFLWARYPCMWWPSASEGRGNNLKAFKDLNMKATARIWL